MQRIVLHASLHGCQRAHSRHERSEGIALFVMEQTKKSFLKNMVGFSLVAWVSFAIGFVASPIATRLFIPEEMGKINLFNTYASLFASFCYLGLDQAFVRFFREPPGRSTRGGMLTFCTVSSVGVGCAFALLLLLGWQGISARVVGEARLSVFICLAVFGMSTILFRYLSLYYRMEQNAKWYTLQGIMHVLLTKVAYLSVGFGTAKGEAAIGLLTVLMATFTLVFVVKQRSCFSRTWRQEVDAPFLKEIGRYAIPLLPVALIGTLNTSVNQLVISRLEGLSDVGIYTSAQVLASTVNIIQTGFNTYWAAYVYENYRTDNKRRFFTVHRLMACALTMFGLTVTLLQAVVFLLLGPLYRSSAIFFPFLFLAPICYCLSETTGMGIGISKKTHWNTITLLASVVVNWLLSQWLISLWGATGAAISSAAAAILFLVWRTWAGERYYKAISDYRYIVYALGLLIAASVGNLLLATQPIAKYILLASLYLIAVVLFRKEINTFLRTGLEVLREGRGALTRRTHASFLVEKPVSEDDADPSVQNSDGEGTA